jgi:hypothetical protein
LYTDHGYLLKTERDSGDVDVDIVEPNAFVPIRAQADCLYIVPQCGTAFHPKVKALTTINKLIAALSVTVAESEQVGTW